MEILYIVFDFKNTFFDPATYYILLIMLLFNLFNYVTGKPEEKLKDVTYNDKLKETFTLASSIGILRDKKEVDIIQLSQSTTSSQASILSTGGSNHLPNDLAAVSNQLPVSAGELDRLANKSIFIFYYCYLETYNLLYSIFWVCPKKS